MSVERPLGYNPDFAPATRTELAKAQERIDYSNMLTNYVDEHGALDIASRHIERGASIGI